VRVRPLLPREAGQQEAVRSCGQHIGLVDDKGKERFFSADVVLDSRATFDASNEAMVPEASQEVVYEALGQDIVRHAMEGHNACLLAHGHSGSGKTYTVLGEDWNTPEAEMGAAAATVVSDSAGLLPRTLSAIFEALREDKGAVCVASFYEIYNERIRDLAASSSRGEPGQLRGLNRPAVHYHPRFGAFVSDVTEQPCQDVAEAMHILASGAKLRTTAPTPLNERSSRSHAVFTLRIERATTSNRLLLVDLAGRETERLVQSCSERFRELTGINRSLFHLAGCVRALGSGSQAGVGAGHGHCHHLRNSKLTMLLGHALAGNSYTTLVSTISPARSAYEDSVSTLRFCESMRQVQTRPMLASTKRADAVHVLQDEVKKLQAELMRTNSGKVQVERQLHETKALMEHYRNSWQQASSQLVHLRESPLPGLVPGSASSAPASGAGTPQTSMAACARLAAAGYGGMMAFPVSVGVPVQQPPIARAVVSDSSRVATPRPPEDIDTCSGSAGGASASTTASGASTPLRGMGGASTTPSVRSSRIRSRSAGRSKAAKGARGFEESVRIAKQLLGALERNQPGSVPMAALKQARSQLLELRSRGRDQGQGLGEGRSGPCGSPTNRRPPRIPKGLSSSGPASEPLDSPVEGSGEAKIVSSIVALLRQLKSGIASEQSAIASQGVEECIAAITTLLRAVLAEQPAAKEEIQWTPMKNQHASATFSGDLIRLPSAPNIWRRRSVSPVSRTMPPVHIGSLTGSRTWRMTVPDSPHSPTPRSVRLPARSLSPARERPDAGVNWLPPPMSPPGTQRRPSPVVPRLSMRSISPVDVPSWVSPRALFGRRSSSVDFGTFGPVANTTPAVSLAAVAGAAIEAPSPMARVSVPRLSAPLLQRMRAVRSEQRYRRSITSTLSSTQSGFLESSTSSTGLCSTARTRQADTMRPMISSRSVGAATIHAEAESDS